MLALTFHLVHGQSGLGGRALDSFADNWLYDGIVMGAAISCLARAVQALAIAWQRVHAEALSPARTGVTVA